MNHISDKQFEELAKKWPVLFQKSRVDDFGVGEGWLSIIDTLCCMISGRIENQKRSLSYYKERPVEYAEDIIKAEAEVARLSLEIPIIVQVKEKFGGLRFYVSSDPDGKITSEVYNYIAFAEAMSMCTCEQCGAPGEARNTGWTKVLCDRHHNERVAEKNRRFSSAIKPPLSSDDL